MLLLFERALRDFYQLFYRKPRSARTVSAGDSTIIFSRADFFRECETKLQNLSQDLIRISMNGYRHNFFEQTSPLHSEIYQFIPIFSIIIVLSKKLLLEIKN